MKSFYQNREQSLQCNISNNLNYPPHLHKQLELIYVLSGELLVTINGESRNLKAGELAISFPNSIHSIQTPNKSQIILLIFDLFLVESYQNILINQHPMNPFLFSTHLHKDVIYNLFALLEMNTHHCDFTLAKGYLTIIIGQLLKSLTLEKVDYENLKLVSKVLIYIDQHFTEPLKLDSVAYQVNASKFYISRILNKKLGISFHQYLNSKRIQLAKNLLKSTDYSITEISYQSGFESSRTFYRIFKEHCQMTPREYRLQQCKGVLS